jgi:hypothetical protein
MLASLEVLQLAMPTNIDDLIRLLLLLITAIFTFLNNRQGKEIHTLVNSKMTTALGRIDELEKEIKYLKESKS